MIRSGHRASRRRSAPRRTDSYVSPFTTEESSVAVGMGEAVMGEVEVVPLTSDAKKSPGWGHVEISRGMCM